MSTELVFFKNRCCQYDIEYWLWDEEWRMEITLPTNRISFTHIRTVSLVLSSIISLINYEFFFAYFWHETSTYAVSTWSESTLKKIIFKSSVDSIIKHDFSLLFFLTFAQFYIFYPMKFEMWREILYNFVKLKLKLKVVLAC